MARRLTILLGIVSLACGGRAEEPDVNHSTAQASAGGKFARAADGGASSDGTAVAGNGAAMAAGGTRGSVNTDDLILTQDPPCEAWVSEIPREFTEVYWLADASSSMALEVPGTKSTRWSLTGTLMSDFLDALEADSTCADIRPGLFVFPSTAYRSRSSTAIASESCINDADMILPPSNAWDKARDHAAFIERLEIAIPAGATPILDAYAHVVQAVQQKGVAHHVAIVLVTDGMPTLDGACMEPSPAASWPSAVVGDDTVTSPTPIFAAIRSALATGIRTIVIGAPGSDGQRNWLTLAAIHGGTASANCDKTMGGEPYCHLDMSREPHPAPQVLDLLKRTSVYESCQFPLVTQAPSITNPIDADRLTVFIEAIGGSPEMVTRVPDLAVECQYGFRRVDATTGELCAASCERLRQDCSARLLLAYACRMPKIEETR